MTLTPVFYRTIVSETPLHTIVRHAHVLGYELMPFEGYATGTLGGRGSRPDRAAALENAARLSEILESMPGLDTYTVDMIEVGQPDAEMLDDDDALRIARADIGHVDD